MSQLVWDCQSRRRRLHCRCCCRGCRCRCCCCCWRCRCCRVTPSRRASLRQAAFWADSPRRDGKRRLASLSLLLFLFLLLLHLLLLLFTWVFIRIFLGYFECDFLNFSGLQKSVALIFCFLSCTSHFCFAASSFSFMIYLKMHSQLLYTRVCVRKEGGGGCRQHMSFVLPAAASCDFSILRLFLHAAIATAANLFLLLQKIYSERVAMTWRQPSCGTTLPTTLCLAPSLPLVALGAAPAV